MLVLLLYAGLVQGAPLGECDEFIVDEMRLLCVMDCPQAANIWECYHECERLDLKQRSKCTNLTGLSPSYCTST